MTRRTRLVPVRPAARRPLQHLLAQRGRTCSLCTRGVWSSSQRPWAPWWLAFYLRRPRGPRHRGPSNHRRQSRQMKAATLRSRRARPGPRWPRMPTTRTTGSELQNPPRTAAWLLPPASARRSDMKSDTCEDSKGVRDRTSLIPSPTLASTSTNPASINRVLKGSPDAPGGSRRSSLPEGRRTFAISSRLSEESTASTGSRYPTRT